MLQRFGLKRGNYQRLTRGRSNLNPNDISAPEAGRERMGGMDNNVVAIVERMHVIEDERDALRAENERLRNAAEQNRISLLQYASLRKYFSVLIRAVLGPDYYNLGTDVYSCDGESCCDIAFKCSRGVGYRFKAAAAALEGGQQNV